MNQVFNAINERVSLRKYADKKIDQETLDQIIHAAMRAPTAGNMMLYSIVVIKDQAIKDRLSVTCDNQPFIAKAPVLLLFVADFEKWDRFLKISGVEEYAKEKNLEYEGASPADLMLCIQDAVIAAQNAVIAAESLGIGSCYIGDILEEYEVHKELLNLPENVLPISMITLGYYEENHKKVFRDRFPKEFVVFEDKYKSLSDEEITEMFSEKERSSQSVTKKDNKFGAKNFGQLMFARKIGSDFYKEMNRSIRLMLKNWL